MNAIRMLLLFMTSVVAIAIINISSSVAISTIVVVMATLILTHHSDYYHPHLCYLHPLPGHSTCSHSHNHQDYNCYCYDSMATNVLQQLQNYRQFFQRTSGQTHLQSVLNPKP